MQALRSSTNFNAPTRDRVALLDILRGLALIGILVVNMEYYSQTIYDGWMQPAFSDGLDLIARWLVIAFFQLKAYLLFALLFGYGIGMQLNKLKERSVASIRRTHTRRMMCLAALGILHGVLLFTGDILLTYALLGLLSMFFWRTRPGHLVAWAIGILVVSVILNTVLVLLIPESTINAGYLVEVRNIFATGTFAEIVAQRVTDLTVVFPFVLIVQGPMAFAMLLIGIAMAKRGILTEPNRHRPLLRIALRWELPIGIIGGIVAATLMLSGSGDGLAAALGFFFQLVTGPSWCLGIIALIALLWAELKPTWLKVVRTSGRMSLSVYIAQSLLGALIFTAYGLGWFARIGPAESLAIAVVVAGSLGLTSAWWLGRFRFGPLEWLLRSSVYGRWQSMRTTQ